MATKIVLFFSLGNYGWSETYYNDATTLDGGFAAAWDLGKARSRLLGDPASLDYIRVSIEGQPRVSTLTGIGGGTPYVPPRFAYTSQADRPTTAALIQAFSSTGQCQRKITLRGMPDLVFDRSDPTNTDAVNWDNNLFNYLFAQLTDTLAGWAIKKRIRPSAAPTRWDVTAVANVAGTLNSTLTVLDPFTGSVGDLLQMYKFKGAIPAPGLVRVVNVSLDKLTVTVAYSFPNNFLYVLGGYFVAASFSYEDIDFCQFERFSAHKTGRTFGLARGRAPARPR